MILEEMWLIAQETDVKPVTGPLGHVTRFKTEDVTMFCSVRVNVLRTSQNNPRSSLLAGCIYVPSCLCTFTCLTN